VLPVLLKKIIVIQLLSLVFSANLVGCPCPNVSNTLVWRFSTRRFITFRPFLWITSQFHYGILEPPMKINLCHCQFVLMLLNIHFFLGPLLIGIPSHWLFAPRSHFSLSMEFCWARHPPIIVDHHDTPAVTGGLHPLLDTSPKNRRFTIRTTFPDYVVHSTKYSIIFGSCYYQWSLEGPMIEKSVTSEGATDMKFYYQWVAHWYKINQSINQKRIRVTKVTNVTARPLLTVRRPLIWNSITSAGSILVEKHSPEGENSMHIIKHTKNMST